MSNAGTGGQAPAGGRILVVDEDPDARNIIDVVLGKAGFHVTQAVHGVEAISKAVREHFDLIVSDVDFPMDGARLLETLRRKGLAIPVLFLTAADGEDLGVPAGAGAEYIQKPFRRDAFLTVVHRLLDKKTA